MTPTNGQGGSLIDKRDFDSNRPLLRDVERNRGASRSPASSRSYADHDGDGLRNEVVEEIVERDRRKLEKEVIRICSFIWGVISW